MITILNGHDVKLSLTENAIKQSFTLPQAITAVQMLLDIGAGSLLVFGNLIKLLKRHYELGLEDS